MAVQVWCHERSSQGPVLVAGNDVGTFLSGCAYVCLKQESPPLVFVWTGSAASDETNVAAQAHATELVDTLPAGTSLIQLVEGSESAEFSKLFEKVNDKPSETSAHVEDDAGVAAAGPGPAGSKKKRKKKKKATAGAETNVPTTEQIPTEAESVDEEEEVAPDTIKDEAAPKAEPVLPAPTEPTPAPQQEPIAVQEPVVVPNDPVVTAAEEEAVPETKEATPEQANQKQELPLIDANADSEILQSKGVLSDVPAANTPSLPAVSTAAQSTPGVGKPTSASVSPPARQSSTSPTAGPVTYLADSARAWSAEPITQKINVAIPPGSKSFPYEELKTLRNESGIDVTCKEAYLNDDDFVKVFNKDRAAFAAQPAWRRLMQKKAVGLW